MVIALLVALNAGSLCVARTDICAPPSSTIEGEITPTGGHVTITPAKPMQALGAEFPAGRPLIVDVLPWSSDRMAGAIVHVRGELAHESVISGARVTGVVRIGQQQGRLGKPQLVEAKDIKGGKLAVFAAGTVDLAPGMAVAGSVDIDGGRIQVTSPQPMHGLDLDLAAGTLQVDARGTSATITATLARAQEIAGVLVDKQVAVTLEPKHPMFRYATLARTTPLALLGLPAGQAPAGTLVITDAAATRLAGPGPVTMCGVSLLPVPTIAQPAVTITRATLTTVKVTGGIAGRDVDLGGGVFMSGSIAASYDTASCRLVGIAGSLSRESLQLKLRFAARAAFAIDEVGKDRFVRGTLVQREVVDGMTVTGAIMVRATPAGDVHLAEGTLATPARFEEWQLAEGTQIHRFEPGGWSFTAPRGKPARALAEHRGERVDAVTEGRSDGNSTMLMLVRPHTVKGTTLAFDNLGIDHDKGCVLGGAATRQHFGIFTIPAGGSATVCGGAVVAAVGNFAVPSLQVGSWFATSAIAGALGSAPPRTPDEDGRLAPTPPVKRSSSATGAAGYWIQINSLCQGAAGIPLPPPPQRWIWIDAKGQAPNPTDQKELAKLAAKPGAPCPVTPCCPP